MAGVLAGKSVICVHGSDPRTSTSSDTGPHVAPLPGLEQLCLPKAELISTLSLRGLLDKETMLLPIPPSAADAVWWSSSPAASSGASTGLQTLAWAAIKPALSGVPA